MARLSLKAVPSVRAPARSMTSFAEVTKRVSKLNGDQIFLASSVALGTCLPTSILFAPSFLATPFDTVVALALPVHMATGVCHIAEDYAPPAYKELIVKLIKLIAIIAAYGLLKISLCGSGIGHSIKSLWLERPRGKKVATN